MTSTTIILGTLMPLIIQAYALPAASVSTAAQPLDAAESSSYSPVLIALGADLFSHFTAYTSPDPTHGFINYTDMSFAYDQGYLSTPFLAEFKTSVARLRIDDTHVQPSGRNSVRLSSKTNFTVGTLLVLDVAHVPAAWGQWSSFWLLGQDGTWPTSGEIDIFESVHMNTGNTITLHTSPGCVVANQSRALGTLIQADCNAGSANEGCSTIVPSTVTAYDDTIMTAGQPFNNNKGAVFVTEWTSTGIEVWMFNREAVPYSLTTEHPSTSDFPPPVASFAGPGCSFDKAFREMQLIINIDACGDWAGQVWQSSGAARATGFDTCASYVQEKPEAMQEAYFDFLSLAVYSSTSTA